MTISIFTTNRWRSSNVPIDEELTSTDAASNVDEDIAKFLKEQEKLNEMMALVNKKSENSETMLKLLPDEKMKHFFA